MTWIKICGITTSTTPSTPAMPARTRWALSSIRRARATSPQKPRARSSPACPANRKGRSVRQRNGGPRSRHRQTRRPYHRAIERRREHGFQPNALPLHGKPGTRKRLAASAIFRAWPAKVFDVPAGQSVGWDPVAAGLVEPDEAYKGKRVHKIHVAKNGDLFLETHGFRPGVISGVLLDSSTAEKRGGTGEASIGSACNPGPESSTASAS